jgi:hypothetical protein
MKPERTFAIQTFLVTFVLNAILLGALFWLMQEALQTNNELLLFFGIGGAVTLVLWLAIFFLGRRLIEETTTTQLEASLPPPVAERPAPRQRAAPSRTAAAPTVAPTPVAPALPYEASAVQLLSILQRRGRLIDFLQEDLAQYEDSQVGAAVRNIHEGCKQALADHVRLEPIFAQSEGSTITVQRDFDANEVRLSGNVVGNPPFRGILRHRGWRAAEVELPKLAPAQTESRVVAAAEVEIDE